MALSQKTKHNQNFRPNLTGVGQCVFCQRLRPSRTPPSNVSHRCIFVQNDTLLEIDSGGPTILLHTITTATTTNVC